MMVMQKFEIKLLFKIFVNVERQKEKTDFFILEA